jgi:hypothetical protein
MCRHLLVFYAGSSLEKLCDILASKQLNHTSAAFARHTLDVSLLLFVVELHRRVFEKLCDDFASKRRERVVRLDIPLQAFQGPAAASSQRSGSSITGRPGSGVLAGGQQQGLGVWGAGATGLDELCIGLRDSIRAAFEARQAAYDAEVRTLLTVMVKHCACALHL